MRVFLKPTQDATIYQRYPTINTGLDEILEVGKLKNSDDTLSAFQSASCRALLDFNVTANMFPTGAKYYLNLYVANGQDINRGQRLEVYPLQQQWDEGNGYFYQLTERVDETNETGVTWQNRNTGISWPVSGGSFQLTPSASTLINDRPLRDIRIDVSTIIDPVNRGTSTIPGIWNGLIVKYSNVDEANQQVVGNLKFFSSNTATIFSPTLEVVWNDQVFITGSLKAIPNTNISILPKNIKQSYKEGEVSKVYLVARDRYPDKRYDTVQRYKGIYYLPRTSYFRVRDEVSDVELFRFDEYSAISCDANGPYFMLDTRGFAPNRYYTIDLKVELPDGQVFFPDFKYKFKIEEDE